MGYLSFTPDPGDDLMELPEDCGSGCSLTLRDSTGNSSGPTAFEFPNDLSASVTSSAVGSSLRACAVGCWGTFAAMSGFRFSEFAFNRVLKNRAHLTRICLGSRSGAPSPSQIYCESTFRVSSIRKILRR